MALSNIKAQSFEHSITLNKDAFKGLRFYFNISEVIDARPDNKRPIGSYRSKNGAKAEYIGNDSLGKEILSFCKGHPSFVGAGKIILVINQFNIRQSITIEENKFIYIISLDYYKTSDNGCVLSYKQYFTYEDRGTNDPKALNKTLNSIFEKAFLEYKSQTSLYKPISEEIIPLAQFYNAFKAPVDSVFTMNNLSDGVYLSYRDLYFKKPLLLKDLILPDTSEIEKNPIILRSPTYIMQRAYAIVKNGRIFVNVSNNTYREVTAKTDGKLYFDDRVIRTISKDTKVGLILLTFAPGGNYAKDAIINSASTENKVSIYVDYRTGDFFRGKVTQIQK